MTDTATPTGLRIGTAPDSWGVWFPEHPRQTPWTRFLDEVQQADYAWVELGPYGYLPTDPHQLEDELGIRGLGLTGGTIFTGFHKSGETWNRVWEQAEKVAQLVRALGAEHIVVIPDLWRSDATGEALEPRTLNDEGWDRLAAGHNRLGKALLEEYGIHQQFHSHADSHVGTAGEVERLLESTDARYLNLCLDTGHFAYYGGDSMALVKRHPERIGYLHLKQINSDRCFEALKNDVPFASAATQVMVEPPNGIPDFAPVIDAVAAIDSSIFAVVEQDMPGVDIDVPLGIATRTREYIFSCTPSVRRR